MELNTPITDFPGIGPARAQKLEKLGVRTAGDLLNLFPRDYEDRREYHTIRSAPLGRKVCIRAMAAERPHLSRIRKGMELVKFRAVDESGTLYLTFFNQSYLERLVRAGEDYILYGLVEEQGNRRTMTNPVLEPVGRQSATGRILPIYPLTAGITNNLLLHAAERAVEECLPRLPETLPVEVCREYELIPAQRAYRDIHFPASFGELEQARRRLTFEELFYLSVGLAQLKHRRAEQGTGTPFRVFPVEEFAALLPFSLTEAQERAMEDIGRDLAFGRTMNRLVQGDVGSGKTMVAAYAVWLAANSGAQAALMAPTEVLARQHYQNLSALLEQVGVRVVLLTGAMGAKAKREAKEQLELGMAQLAIGTHALLSEGVNFINLALVVTDEQHRFGVAQRAALAAKGAIPGGQPHVLVMSATPIPRTLALIIYGDLDVSVIDQLPPGRTPVETYVVGEDKRQRMYGFVRKLVAEGRQAYIVCPAVEEAEPSDDPLAPPPMDLKAVTVYAKHLKEEVFPDLTVDFLHGKMRPKEKEAVMAAFAAGQTQILVATTVIEVGVDVPNAALIIIENGERFGLSQLHQLRGRVGRGKHQSYCVIITPSRSETARQRLKTLASTTDGFKISEEDLKLRGPGDFFGNRQHGLPALHVADLAGDMRTLQQAQQAAEGLLAADPNLELPQNRPVRERVREMFRENPDIFN